MIDNFLAVKYGVKITYYTDDRITNNYIDNSAIAGNDIFIGVYDDPRKELISFFHEIGHKLIDFGFKEKWNFNTLIIEIECWNIAIEEARKNGIVFDDEIIQYGYAKAMNYVGWDKREKNSTKNRTRTLAIIKPDMSEYSFGRHYIQELINKTNIDIKACSSVEMSKKKAAEFYAEHKNKEFFKRLTDLMSSGKCIAMILEGENVITKWRELMKQIRAKYSGKELHENCVHGSDSPEAAEREIKFFFNK